MEITGIQSYILAFLALLQSCTCNKYSPHLVPKAGPFFEGWYVRIVPCHSRDSFGFLFGNVLPKPNQVTSDPLVIASVLLRRNCPGTNCTLTTHDAFFNKTDLNITVDNGKPVTTEPDYKSPADFQWRVVSDRSRAIFQQRNNVTLFDFRIGNLNLMGSLGHPRPWGPDGEGPEGWIDRLPFLPLHWFVFSLNSSVHHYAIKDQYSGKTISEDNCGFAHQEMNWGNSFPKAWIWSQGYSSNNAVYAISGGPVSFKSVSITAYLMGYRNPSKGLTLDFRPDDSIFTVKHFGCQGYVNVTARGMMHEIHMEISAPISTFSACLFGPEVSGFRKASIESYDAVTRVRVYEGIFSRKLVDTQNFASAALEFGGDFVCNKKCS